MARAGRNTCTALLAAALAASALTACGKQAPTASVHTTFSSEGLHGQGEGTSKGEGSGKGEGSTEGQGGSGGEGDSTLSKSQAAAFVHSVNLRASDVSGFKASQSHNTPAHERQLERQLTRCLGGNASREGHGTGALAEASSEEFERTGDTGYFGVSSTASVARTAAIAAESLAAIRSERVRDCISSYVTKLLEGKHFGSARLGHVHVSSQEAAAPGTSGAFVLRIRAGVSVGHTTLPIELDLFGFVCGQAELQLLTTSLPAPFPAQARQQLLSILLGRAKAHGECAAASGSGESSGLAQ